MLGEVLIQKPCADPLGVCKTSNKSQLPSVRWTTLGLGDLHVGQHSLECKQQAMAQCLLRRTHLEPLA